MADAHGPAAIAGIWGSSAWDISPKVWKSLGAALLGISMDDLPGPAPLVGSGPSEHPHSPFGGTKVSPPQRWARLGPHCCPLESCPSSGTARNGSTSWAGTGRAGRAGAAGLAGAAAGPQGIQISQHGQEWGPQDRENSVLHGPIPGKRSELGKEIPSTGRACSGAAPAGGAQLSSRGTEPGAKGSGGPCLAQHHAASVWGLLLRSSPRHWDVGLETAQGSAGLAIPGNARKLCGCSPWGHGAGAALAVLGEWKRTESPQRALPTSVML